MITTKVNFHGDHLNSHSLLISPCLPTPLLWPFPSKCLNETNRGLQLEPVSWRTDTCYKRKSVIAAWWSQVTFEFPCTQRRKGSECTAQKLVQADSKGIPHLLVQQILSTTVKQLMWCNNEQGRCGFCPHSLQRSQEALHLHTRQTWLHISWSCSRRYYWNLINAYLLVIFLNEHLFDS